MAIDETHPNLIFDLEAATGPVEIWSDGLSIREMIAHGRGRYSQTPPPGTKIRGPGWSPPSSNREGVAIVPTDLLARDRVIVFDLLGDSDRSHRDYHALSRRGARGPCRSEALESGAAERRQGCEAGGVGGMNVHAPIPMLDVAPAVPPAADAVDALARMLDAAKLSSEQALLDAVRSRRVQLGLSLKNLDLAAGLAAGHASKCTSPARIKSPSTKTLFALLDALALSVVLVHDPSKAERISPTWRRRDESHVRQNPPSPLAVAKSRPAVIAELARKANHARWRTTSASEFMQAMMENAK